jgi:hypothetical protein
VKTTMMFRTIANPRRTTLAHLVDADELQPPVGAVVVGPAGAAESPEHTVELPQRTANPRRTVLVRSATD